MAEHQSLASNLELKVFFCHAHSPWARATCESQNDRIRRYLPKGTALSMVLQISVRGGWANNSTMATSASTSGAVQLRRS
jgi:IS30 family transposase